MRFRTPGLRSVVLISGALLGTGCVAVPKMTPNVIGLGDLSMPNPSLSESRLPPATNLPRLSASGPSNGAMPRPAYTIGPLDQITVTIWGRKDLGSQVPVGQSGELRASTVREDGTLVLPFIDPFPVRGKTLVELRTDIEKRYAGLFAKPQVDVTLFSCASAAVQVTGEVLKPGRYYLCANQMTVGEVLSSAGSVTAFTDVAGGILTRKGELYRIVYTPESAGAYGEVLLQDGDSIYFPRAEERLVYVLGEFIHQGSYPIPRRGMTLVEALGKASGTDSYTASVSGVFLIRSQEPEHIVVYQLAMGEILQGPAIPLIDQDRVFVAVSPLTRWERFWRKILPFDTVFRTSYRTAFNNNGP